MRKFLIIIFMYVIASNSYYGVVNEKGQKVTDINMQKQEEIKEQNDVEENKKTEDKAEQVNAENKIAKEKNSIVQKSSEDSVDNKSNNKQKDNKANNVNAETKIDLKQNTEQMQQEKVKIEQKQNEKSAQETKVTEKEYVRNDTMIEKMRQVIKNNETENMKKIGYNIVVDSSIKSKTNQFTFTESRVINNIKYSFGTIRIYAEDYYSNGQLVMTECYIL